MENAVIHPDDHVAMLEELLGGEDPRVAFSRSRLASCTECRAWFDDLMAVSAVLDKAGADVRRVVAVARQSDTAPGEARTESVLRQQFQMRHRARARARVATLVAAVALLGVVGWLAAPAGDASRPVTVLGANGFVADAPIGAVAAYGVLEWHGPLPPGGWYVVRVLDPARNLIDQSPRLTAPRWQPDAQVQQRWPDRIRWEVRVFHPSAAHLETLAAEAWRR